MPEINQKINEKTSFIIGLLALILAILPFKQTIEKIEIIIFDYSLSIIYLLIIMILFLFLSIYFYALNTIKYSSIKFLNFKLFNYIYNCGEMLYILAILFPLIMILFWVISTILFFTLPILKNYNLTIAIISSLLTIISSIYFTTKMTNIKKEKESEALIEDSDTSLIKVKELIKKKQLNYAILEINNALNIFLEGMLIGRIQIEQNKINNLQIIELAFKQKLIDSEQKSFLNYIRLLRNQIAHNKKIFINNKEIQELLKKSETLINTVSNENIRYPVDTSVLKCPFCKEGKILIKVDANNKFLQSENCNHCGHNL